jgi:DNA modification methylase
MSQLVFFRDTLSKSKLPTNLTTRNHAVHRWFNFIAGFSPEFVSSCIESSGVKANKGVLIDPFAGMSTALVQANIEGVRSIGYDPHPFFYDMSQAKLELGASEIIDQVEVICKGLAPCLEDLSSVWGPNAVKFLIKLVPDTELRILASAFLEEHRIPKKIRLMFRLIVSRALEATTKSQTDGIYKAPTSAKRSKRFHEAIPEICEEIREDLYLVSKFYVNRAMLYASSSQHMNEVQDGSCSLCVTSPPYLNNFDFAEMTRMELYFWKYAKSWGDITELVRRKLIVNTTTAPTDLKRRQSLFKNSLPPGLIAHLEPLVTELRATKKERGGSKDYDLLVYPYFSQMSEVISELYRVLAPNASLHLLVADAALYGVHIHTEHFLASLMSEIGFDLVKVDRLRNRGDRWVLDKRQGSSMPLGEFHIHARRS